VAIVGMPSRSSMLSLGTQERLLLLFMQDQNPSRYLQLYFIPFHALLWGSFRLIRRIDGEARIMYGRKSRSW
jgi:hypothetical protein